MLGAIYVLFLHNQSMLEKLFGVLIGCVYTALSVWVLAGFTKLICTDKFDLYWSFFNDGEIVEVFAFSFYELLNCDCDVAWLIDGDCSYDL